MQHTQLEPTRRVYVLRYTDKAGNKQEMTFLTRANAIKWLNVAILDAGYTDARIKTERRPLFGAAIVAVNERG